MKNVKSAIILVLVTFLSACSWLPEQVDETKSWSASRLYAAAKQALRDEEYDTAIKFYERIESRYPFGRYAQQAQLEIVYAYYKFEEPESALAAADRFIKIHPSHPHVDYVYYLKGLINFNRSSIFLEKFFPQDPSTRDPGNTRQSFVDFGKLLKKFPNSKYADDARQRMLYLRNNLARYELHVANYYMERGAWVAAANRGKYVIIHYNGAPAVPHALVIMSIAYDKLGMHKLAKDARRVLKKSYPGFNPNKSFKKQKRWWQII